LNEAEAAAHHPHSRMMIQRMRAQYAGFSKDLARLVVAHVPEIRTENGDFQSLQWEKPLSCDDFRTTTRTEDTPDAPETTIIKAAHDNTHVYLKFTASDRMIGKQEATTLATDREQWPRGDRIEFWLFGGRDCHVFAFNANGARYDAKNLDRAWDSGWHVRTRKNQQGWEAVVVIPLTTFGFTPGKATHWRWFCTRQVSREDGSTYRMSYQGHPLYYRNFPIVVE
jgi:hypothetical protein